MNYLFNDFFSHCQSVTLSYSDDINLYTLCESSSCVRPHRGRMIPPVQRTASCTTAVGKTKHEAQRLWQCADMFHSVSALRHIGTISHGPLTLGPASGNFRGSFDNQCDSPSFEITDTRCSFWLQAFISTNLIEIQK